MFILVIGQTPPNSSRPLLPRVEKGSRSLGKREFSLFSICPLTLNGLEEEGLVVTQHTFTSGSNAIRFD